MVRYITGIDLFDQNAGKEVRLSFGLFKQSNTSPQPHLSEISFDFDFDIFEFLVWGIGFWALETISFKIKLTYSIHINY